MTDTPSLMLAAAAGFVSFLSPCCLPLVPGYLAVVTGESASEITKPGLLALSRAFLFVATFSSIFVLVGLSATAAGSFITGNQELLTKIAGLSIAVMGAIFVASTVAIQMKFSWRSSALIERAEHGRGAPVIAGAAFAVAWTPCVGPTLGAILGLAALQGTAAQGALLLAAYSAGLAIPFLLTAAGVQFLQDSFGFIRRHYDALQLVSGLVLIVIGALVFSGEFFRMNILARSFIDSTGLDFLDFLWRI